MRYRADTTAAWQAGIRDNTTGEIVTFCPAIQLIGRAYSNSSTRWNWVDAPATWEMDSALL